MGKFCLVGHLKVGSVGRPEIFIFLFCWPLPIEFIPQHPQSNLLQPPPPIQIIYNHLHSHSNYYIWFLTNEIQTNPFWLILLLVTFDLLILHMQNDEKWSLAWWKIVEWSIWTLTAQKPCLHIIKQSFQTASPSAFALLLYQHSFVHFDRISILNYPSCDKHKQIVIKPGLFGFVIWIQ